MTASDVLGLYRNEELPEFVGIELSDVNQRGAFGNRPLNLAATRGALTEVQALLDGGAEIDAQGEHGSTPLHDAVGQGHVEIVRVLLARGARRDLKNDSGMTARDRAVQKNLQALVAAVD